MGVVTLFLIAMFMIASETTIIGHKYDAAGIETLKHSCDNNP